MAFGKGMHCTGLLQKCIKPVCDAQLLKNPLIEAYL